MLSDLWMPKTTEEQSTDSQCDWMNVEYLIIPGAIEKECKSERASIFQEDQEY